MENNENEMFLKFVGLQDEARIYSFGFQQSRLADAELAKE
jgi:hypothetical protein